MNLHIDNKIWHKEIKSPLFIDIKEGDTYPFYIKINNYAVRLSEYKELYHSRYITLYISSDIWNLKWDRVTSFILSDVEIIRTIFQLLSDNLL